MAGIGPPPKHPSMRQRRNRVAGAAVLPSEGPKTPPPPLPEREGEEWHPETMAYWAEVWASPMATEYLPADVPGLVGLFKLVDRYNWGHLELAAEIRLQRVCFGLTPIDRRRLQWEVSKVEEAQRKRPSEPVKQPTAKDDPRQVLRFAK